MRAQHRQRSHKIDFAYVTQITVEAYFEARAESQRRSGKQRSVEAGLIAGTIRFILGDFTFTFLVIGLIASGVALLRAPKPLTASAHRRRAVLLFSAVLSLGFSLLYNFVLHTFLGEMTAAYIGWKDRSIFRPRWVLQASDSPWWVSLPFGAVLICG